MSDLLAIAASKVERILGTTLYGQFTEFMRDPDDHKDKGDVKFNFGEGVYRPISDQNTLSSHHSLQIAIARDNGQGRGSRHGSIPLRAGLEVAQ
jgi:hypothetical protein